MTQIESLNNSLRSDRTVAIDEYLTIAELFYSDKLKDYQTAAYFYKRCNSLAKAIGVISTRNWVIL